MSSPFSLASSPECLTPSQKRGGRQFLRVASDMLQAVKAPRGHGSSALRCPGSPPPTFSEQNCRNRDRVFNFHLPGEKEFVELNDDDICPVDDAYEYELDGQELLCRLQKVDSALASSFPDLSCDDNGEIVDWDMLEGVGMETEEEITVSPSDDQLNNQKPEYRLTEEISSDYCRMAQAGAHISIFIAPAAEGAPSDGIEQSYAKKDTHGNQSTSSNEYCALNITPKRPIYQPPPRDDEVSDGAYQSDEEDQGESDDWHIVDIEIDDKSGVDGPEPLCDDLTEENDSVRDDPIKKRHGSGIALDSASNKSRCCHPRIHPLCAAKYMGFFDC